MACLVACLVVLVRWQVWIGVDVWAQLVVRHRVVVLWTAFVRNVVVVVLGQIERVVL